MSKKATVIVPVYNMEKYLAKCFDSLLAQTSGDFEVLAVNDGSKDGSDDIIRSYVTAHRDRMKGLKKENGGWGSAIQTALKVIQTEYFLVLDADDTLAPDAMKILLEMAEKGNADLVIGAKNYVYEGSDKKDYDCAYNKGCVTLKTNSVYTQGSEDFKDLFFVDPSPHAKLYSRSLMDGVVMPEHVSYCDNILFYMSLLNAKRVLYTDQALSDYLIDRKGNSMSDVSFSAMNGQIRVFKTIMNQAGYVKDVPEIFYYRMFASFKYMLYETRRLKCTMDQYDEILDYLDTYAQKLTAHKEAIEKYYPVYEKTGFIEKQRDRMLLRERSHGRAYASIKKKMMKEFEGKALKEV